MITDPGTVVKRSLDFARDRSVTSIDGEPVEVDVRSLCVHGDTPGAAGIARRVRVELEAAGVRVESFA